jgi:hypothetical protein
MANPIFNVDPAAFAKYPWAKVIEAVTPKLCHEYFPGFFAESQRLADAGDATGEKVYACMGAICHFSFHPTDKADNPYGATWREPTRRSAAPEDLGDDGLRWLKEVAPTVIDSDLRGRMFDLIWILGRDFKAVGEAAKAYTAVASALVQANAWRLLTIRLERALQLGGRLGKTKPPFSETLKLVEDSLLAREAGEDELVSADLLDLIEKQKVGDPARWGKHAESLAKRCDQTGKAFFARRYWDYAQLLWRAAGNDTSAKAAGVAAAETYVAEADAALARKRPSYGSAGSCLAQAIDALRKAGGSKKRIGVLKRRMLSYQRQSVRPESGEYGGISKEFDISSMVAAAREGVAGKSLRDALLWLACAASPLVKQKLREQTVKSMQQDPFVHLIAAVVTDHEGKPIARKPSASPMSQEELDEAVTAQMWMDAKLNRELVAQGLLLPAIDTILREHEPRLRDLAFLVLHSPLVPAGREDLFARGLLAGLRKDFVEAAHYLLPQIENSIRHVLTQRGVIASGLNNDLLQSNFGLKTLLVEMTQTEKVFGEDFVFDLRGLLIEKLGSNLRNEFAHGLISFHGFHSPDVVYFWGQCLRFAALPVLAHEE